MNRNQSISLLLRNIMIPRVAIYN